MMRLAMHKPSKPQRTTTASASPARGGLLEEKL